MTTPNLVTILTDAKKQGLKVTKASCTVNGQSAYRVEGRPGLFTKQGLMDIIGLYA